MHRRQMTIFSLLLSFVSFALFAADDWPRWMGPKMDGVWRETGLVEKFAGPEVPIVWRAKVGPGYRGPSVYEGLVFVTDRVIEPKQEERVLAFDAKTGKPAWTFVYDCKYSGVGYEAGPRASRAASRIGRKR